jgi:hypothetical protein
MNTRMERLIPDDEYGNEPADSRESRRERSNRRMTWIIYLYRTMPGAPMPPKDERGYLWGEVEGTDHWSFCEAIVDLIDAAAEKAVQS